VRPQVSKKKNANMKSHRPETSRSPELEEDRGLENVTKSITLEADLAEWLMQESSKLQITPSTFMATLLEWARDEEVLTGDPGFTPPMSRLRKRSSRSLK